MFIMHPYINFVPWLQSGWKFWVYLNIRCCYNPVKMKKYIIIGLMICMFMVSGCAETPKPEDYTCEQDSDCVIAKRIGICCGCPWAFHKEHVEADKNLVIYMSEEHLAAPMPEECKGISCELCPDLNKYDLKCVGGQCKMVLKEEVIE